MLKRLEKSNWLCHFTRVFSSLNLYSSKKIISSLSNYPFVHFYPLNQYGCSHKTTFKTAAKCSPRHKQTTLLTWVLMFILLAGAGTVGQKWNGKLSGILISIYILLSIVGDTSFYTRVWLPESVRVGISLDSTFTSALVCVYGFIAESTDYWW